MSDPLTDDSRWTLTGWGGPEALRLLDAVDFFGDPLNPDRPVPQWAYDGMCSCDHAGRHVWWCPGTPLYVEVAEPHREGFGHWQDPWPKGLRMRIVCAGHVQQPDGVDYLHHFLGEINGPTHWCDREGRVVYEGE